MTLKKAMNYVIAIFAITVFMIATAPRLFAEYYSIYEGQSQDIKFNGMNKTVTISGLYKELIDLNSGKVLTSSPIYNNSEKPLYLNSNKQYRINLSFTSTNDISNLADFGSSLVIYAIDSQNTLMPLDVYYNYNEKINDILKLSVTKIEKEQYKYTFSYIIDSEVFEKIKETSDTFNEKPKYYTITIGEWAKIKDTTKDPDFISFSNYSDIAIKIVNSDSEITQTEKYTYKLEIPCAIDRTKIILPARIDSDYDGPYKTMCNSSAYLNSETGVYHLKKNEGYYLNLYVTNDTIEKPDLSQINSIILQFYNETEEKVCFTKQMTVDYKDNTVYHGKIGYVQPIDLEEYAVENMTGFIEACGGLNSQIYFKPVFVLKDDKEIITENIGIIKSLVVDLDNSNTITETAREKEISSNGIITSKKTVDAEVVTEKPLKTEKHIENELYISTEKSIKKIIPVSQMLQKNKIDTKNVIGDINLETVSEIPIYVFEVKEKKLFLGFIPVGEKITEKRISAIKEINE